MQAESELARVVRVDHVWTCNVCSTSAPRMPDGEELTFGELVFLSVLSCLASYVAMRVVLWAMDG